MKNERLFFRLIQKLNEIHVRSQATDGITSSFNNTELIWINLN